MPAPRAESPAESPAAQPLAIYIHWPFCRSKCPYCDFNSHVADSIDHAAWRAAYTRELRHYAALLPGRRITSIFFGGGTPSLMEAATVAGVLNDIARLWPVDENAEITLEANPNSAEAGKFAGFRAAGVNRLSLGIQSLLNEELHFLGRAHDAKEARQAIELARANFTRFSFDLIYARRGQTPAAWEAELRAALALAGDHLSLYQLTIEPHTQFYTRQGRGEVLTAPNDEAAAMYEMTQVILADAGMPAYEISNHAKPGEESRHNMTYWRYEDYIGIGPGAHGRFRGQRTGIRDQYPSSDPCLLPSAFCFAADNHRAPDVWMKQVHEKGNGLRAREELDVPTAMREALMMGLRLTEGIAHKNWRERFKAPLADVLPPEKIARLIGDGYVANDDAALKATGAGRQRLNAILDYLAV